MRDKHLVDADLYVEDSALNIEGLRRNGCDVITMSHSSNVGIPDEPGGRAHSWVEAEEMIRTSYYKWRAERNLPLPLEKGRQPPSVA